jgi:hypothetical protein
MAATARLTLPLEASNFLPQRARGLLPERKIDCAPSMSRLRRSLWPWPPGMWFVNGKVAKKVFSRVE